MEMVMCWHYFKDTAQQRLLTARRLFHIDESILMIVSNPASCFTCILRPKYETWSYKAIEIRSIQMNYSRLVLNPMIRLSQHPQLELTDIALDRHLGSVLAISTSTDCESLSKALCRVSSTQFVSNSIGHSSSQRPVTIVLRSSRSTCPTRFPSGFQVQHFHWPILRAY